MGFLVIDDESQICATPDATATRPDRPGEGIIQIKSVDQWAFKRTWLNEAGEVEAPIHVLAQTLTEMHMTGASWGTIVALVIGQGVDLHIIDVEPIDGLMATLIQKNRDFWQRVDAGERPPPDYGRDLALIATLNKGRIDPDKTLDLSGDNAFMNAVKDYQDAKARLSVAEKQKTVAEAEMRDKIGDAIAATAGDFFVTLKEVNRIEHMVKASRYRQLRVKDTRA